MVRLLIPGLLAASLGLALPVSAQTAGTSTTAQPQSDYDRVMSGVNASTAGVVGTQPGTPAKTITTKTVSGPFPLASTTGAGVGVNNTAGYGGGGYGGYGNYRAGGYTAPAVAPYAAPATAGNSTTTTTVTNGTAPAQ